MPFSFDTKTTIHVSMKQLAEMLAAEINRSGQMPAVRPDQLKISFLSKQAGAQHDPYYTEGGIDILVIR